MIDPVYPQAQRRRPPPPAALRGVGVRHRRDHLRGRWPGSRRSHAHHDLRLRPLDGQGAGRGAPPPGRRVRRLHHGRQRAAGGRLHRGRRGGVAEPAPIRPAWRRARSSRHLAAAQPLRRPGRRAWGRRPLRRDSPDRRPGNDRLFAIDPGREHHLAVPVGHHASPTGRLLLPRRRLLHPRGTGIISNQEDNHTIVEIGYPSGKILWQYGHPCVPGSAPGYLNQPDDAYLLKSGTITVADASNNRILFISPAGTGDRPDRQRGRRPQPTYLDRLSRTATRPRQRRRTGVGDQRLVDRRVHPGRKAGVDRAHADGELPLGPPAAGPEPLLDDGLRPTGRGPGARVQPTGTVPGCTTWRWRRHAEEAVAGGAVAQRADHGQRRLPQPGGRHRPGDNSIVWQYGITDVSPGRRRGCSRSPTASTICSPTAPPRPIPRPADPSAADRAWTRQADVGQVATGPASAPRTARVVLVLIPWVWQRR